MASGRGVLFECKVSAYFLAYCSASGSNSLVVPYGVRLCPFGYKLLAWIFRSAPHGMLFGLLVWPAPVYSDFAEAVAPWRQAPNRHTPDESS